MKKMYACSYRYGNPSITLVSVSKETNKTITIARVDEKIIGSSFGLGVASRELKGAYFVFFSTWPEVQAWLHDTIGSISDRIAQEQARLQELVELVDKKEEEL